MSLTSGYRSELGGFVVHHNMQQPHVNNFYSSFKTNDLNAFLQLFFSLQSTDHDCAESLRPIFLLYDIH